MAVKKQHGFSVPLWVQLAPVMLVMGGLFVGAFVFALVQSFGYAPWYGINTFPTFSYYNTLLSDDSFWFSAGLTFYYAVVATFLSFVFGTALALSMMKHFRFKGVYKYIYKFPMMIPYSVGIALAVIMMGNSGIISRLMWYFGFIEHPNEFVPMLKTYYGWGIIAVYVWKQTPFVALTVYSVLLGMGRDTIESAMILGAGRMKIFYSVILPQILPGVVAATLICFAFNIGAFEAPFILGAGFPETLPVMAWRYFNDANMEMRLLGMATVVTLTLIVSVILYLYLKSYRAYEHKIGRQ